jgi:hypothetical protein
MLRGEFPLHLLQRQPHRTLHHAFGRAIPVDRPPHEIVDAGIADVLGDRGIDIAQIDEISRQGLRGGGPDQGHGH